MRIRSLFMALPAVALGLACSTMGGSSDRTARTGQGQREVGSAGTGMASGDMKGHASDQVISGRVADTTGGSLVIESSTGDRHTLSLVDQTVVTIDGRDSSAAALQPGQDVRASFNEVDGRQVAVKVEALPAPGSDTYAPASPPGTSPTDRTLPDTSRPTDTTLPDTSSVPAPGDATPPSSSDDSSSTGAGGRY